MPPLVTQGGARGMRACQQEETPMEEPLNIPYRNAFAGRDVCGDSCRTNHNDSDARWRLTCNGESITVIGMLEKMIGEGGWGEGDWEDIGACPVGGWDEIVNWEVHEASMPRAMSIGELTQHGGDPLDLSQPDWRENDNDEEYPSDPVTFTIMSLQQLAEWTHNGRPLPAGSHNSGEDEMHTERSITHPDDPLGLVADKLGRAIANERRSPDGKALEPVFISVYTLGKVRARTCVSQARAKPLGLTIYAARSRRRWSGSSRR